MESSCTCRREDGYVKIGPYAAMVKGMRLGSEFGRSEGNVCVGRKCSYIFEQL